MVRTRSSPMGRISPTLSEEIHEHREEFEQLRGLTRKGPVTLVYAAHDESHNDALVLRETLLKSR